MKRTTRGEQGRGTRGKRAAQGEQGRLLHTVRGTWTEDVGRREGQRFAMRTRRISAAYEINH